MPISGTYGIRNRFKPLLLLWISVTVSISGCISPPGYTLIDPTAGGFVTLSKPLNLPKAPFQEACGPEVLTAILHYWGDYVPIQDVATRLYSPQLGGTLSTELAPFARERGFAATHLEGNIALLKQKIKEAHPLIVMIDMAPSGSSQPAFHFLAVIGYSDQHRAILFRHHSPGPYLAIPYSQLLTRWARAGYFTLEIRPPLAEDLLLIGMELERKGNPQEALKYYNKALEQDPRYHKAYIRIGNLHLIQGELQLAIASYEEAYKLSPEDPEVLNNLANAYAEAGIKLEQASRLAEKATLGYKDCIKGLKLVLTQSRDESVHKRLREKEWALAQAYGTLGQVRYLKAEYTLAISAFCASLDTAPLTAFDFRAKRLYEIALAYKKLDERSQARIYLKKALQIVKDQDLKSKIQEELKD